MSAQAQGTGGGEPQSIAINPDGTITLPTGRYLIMPLDRMQGNGTTGGTPAQTAPTGPQK